MVCCCLQEEVVELEADGEEDEDAEALAEVRVCPVVRGLRPGVDGDHDGRPHPECALERRDDVEAEPSASLEGDVDPVDPVLLCFAVALAHVDFCFERLQTAKWISCGVTYTEEVARDDGRHTA